MQNYPMLLHQILDLVELRPIRSALVGEPGVSGLSVEQRKRLTIAVELVANPSIVFMDEPTSGVALLPSCLSIAQVDPPDSDALGCPHQQLQLNSYLLRSHFLSTVAIGAFVRILN